MMPQTEPARAELPDDLSERARLGDAAAFGRLYDRFWPAICRHTLRMLGGDPDRAREVAQEAFTRAWAAIGDTAPGLRFRPWIYRIATNCCLHLIEKRRPTAPIDELPDLDLEGPDARGLRADERRRVWRTLAALPPRARQVLVLRELDELGFDEIALILGTTAGNVQVILHRARRRFAQALDAAIPLDAEPPSLACPEFDELLGRYVDGDLDSSGRARLARHLEVCAGCDAERKGQRAAAAMLAALPLMPVPPAPPWLGGGVATGSAGAGASAAGAGAGVSSGAAAGAGTAAGLGLVVVAGAKSGTLAMLGLAAVAVLAVGGAAVALSRGPQPGAIASVPAAPATHPDQALSVEPSSEVVAPAPPSAPARTEARPGAAAAAPRATRPRPRAPEPPPAAPEIPAEAERPQVPFGRVLFGQAGARGRGALATGSRLRPGVSLRTAGFVAFALGDGNILRTEPGTRLRASSEHGRPTVRLDDGEIWARRSSQDLHVQAGDVEVDPQGGSVRIRTSLGHTVVEALTDGVAARVRGVRVALSRNQSISSDSATPVALPAAPTGLSPIGWNGTGAPRLSWTEARGAHGYRLELARGADFLDVESAVTTEAPSFQPVVPIGRHFFRVLGTDAAGRRSATSKIQSFFVEPQ